MSTAITNPDRYAVIGCPVDHSLSPWIHQRFARQTGQVLTYERIEADPTRFTTTVHRFFQDGGKGLNITLPHKEAAATLVDETGAEAMTAGAVNTLSLNSNGIRGDNTDGTGLLRDLAVNLGIVVAGQRVLVLGAGGAARGIVAPLLHAEPAELTVANRTVERAEELVASFAAMGPIKACSLDSLAGSGAFDLIINATSTSLRTGTPPFPAAIIGARSFCYDLVYTRCAGTAFTAWAQDLEAAGTASGLGMLVEQAAESFQIWRGIRPETTAVITELIESSR